ncbi:MAG TPA: hypothetical protein VGR35_03395 [Tepidisphaeraceae bacterium]|nr:hypothetical protein [Tepidisphaeraceae bacterium]
MDREELAAKAPGTFISPIILRPLRVPSVYIGDGRDGRGRIT